MIRVGREYYFQRHGALTFGIVRKRHDLPGDTEFFDIEITDPLSLNCGEEVQAIGSRICEDGLAAIKMAKERILYHCLSLRHWEEKLEELESAPDELGSSARADIEQDLAEDREAAQPS